MKTETSAVNVAKAHVEAWSNHDWETSRNLLAEDVRVEVSTTQPIMGPSTQPASTPTCRACTPFADPLVKGSAKILAAVGVPCHAHGGSAGWAHPRPTGAPVGDSQRGTGTDCAGSIGR
jgi:hypothetical protein